MAHGRKTGGREKGTPNRKTIELAEQLARMGCDPVEGMAQIAMDERNAPELRGRMFAELAQYLHPKRRAMEVKAEDGPKVIFKIGTEPMPTPGQLSKVEENRSLDAYSRKALAALS